MNSLSPSVFPDSGADGSASASENHATSSAGTRPPAAPPAPPPPASGPVSASNAKLRSCVTCRRRKVRCDKVSPCSHCRRANIACVFPSDDRPPRWARRLERLTNETATAAASGMKSTGSPDPQSLQVMERLRSLEGLVKELSSQLEQAHAAAGSEAGGSASQANSPHTAGGYDHNMDQKSDIASQASTANVQKEFGRLVLKDANRSRYVSSGFWSRVDVSGYDLHSHISIIQISMVRPCSGLSRLWVFMEKSQNHFDVRHCSDLFGSSIMLLQHHY